MALIYDMSIKTARMEGTRNVVSGGTLEVRDDTDAVIVSFDLSSTGGTVSDDIWTLGFEQNTKSSLLDADANNVVIKDSGGNVRISGLSVSDDPESGAPVIIDNTSIIVGQQVSILSATIQHSADPV
jgi:hypothetical protein